MAEALKGSGDAPPPKGGILSQETFDGWTNWTIL
jgi:hypothetical protein